MERKGEKWRRKSTGSGSSSSTDDEAFFSRKKKQPTGGPVRRGSRRRLTLEEAIKSNESNFIDFNPFQSGDSVDPLLPPNTPKKKKPAESRVNKAKSTSGRRKTIHGTGCSITLPRSSTPSFISHQPSSEKRFPPRSPVVKQQETGTRSGRPSFQFCAFDPLSPIKQTEHENRRSPPSESSSSSDPAEVGEVPEPPKKPRATQNERSSMIERAIQAKNSSFINFNPFQGDLTTTPSEPIKNNKNSGAGQQVFINKAEKTLRRKTVDGSSGNSSSTNHPVSALSAQFESKVNPGTGRRLSDQSSMNHKTGRGVRDNRRVSFLDEVRFKQQEVSELVESNERERDESYQASPPTSLPTLPPSERLRTPGPPTVALPSPSVPLLPSKFYPSLSGYPSLSPSPSSSSSLSSSSSSSSSNFLSDKTHLKKDGYFLRSYRFLSSACIVFLCSFFLLLVSRIFC
ncbi:hypothetical protein PGT21_007241 [Puccinia graminis f. sp. tritici]|uniref:Uncharacterized protein n=2 Tax=Puccinia graminis f. sp. tritici TaxID=56615 RepID=E3JV12_PUCGT|nr:uncharacterized protein PGTG_01218 [Puccinia graminis f. sp. tritici CRL 75-36-700-3]EFP75887.1 hypothetical protein PGTG_01218 [Puccinia graminis f. sp. tritici CRL 75-36-700-3]KAA1077424.1 hypothetical protein PGT21_007241 [Puccinia graminis f. sp. tritici]